MTNRKDFVLESKGIIREQIGSYKMYMRLAIHWIGICKNGTKLSSEK